MNSPLSGRLALVTGASRGIGAAVAGRLAQGGATVVIVARTLEPGGSETGSLRQVAEDIESSGGRAIPIQADLSLPEDRERLVAEAQRHGPIKILVNNAAVAFLLKATEYPGKRLRLMFEVCVHAPFHLSQLVVPEMKSLGEGWILNISSVGAVHPSGPPYAPLHTQGIYTVYGMCKAALDRMSTGLAAELHDSRIAVNSLSPWGWVVSPGTVTNGISDRGDASEIEAPEIIAEAAAFLCSADPVRVTGRVAYSQPLLYEFGLRAGSDNRRP